MDGDEEVRVLVERTLHECYMNHDDYRFTTTMLRDMSVAVAEALATPPESAQPVGEVDEAMVERALLAFYGDGFTKVSGRLLASTRGMMRRALAAARLPAQGGGGDDAEDAVVARLDAAFKDGYAKGYAAATGDGEDVA